MRVAIVHDYLTHFGGAERVLGAMMDVFPEAPVFTVVFDNERVGKWIDESRIKTSPLQFMPGARRSHRYFSLGMMPLAVEQFDLRGFDVILSSSHSFSKGVIVPPGALHICYCFTPTRYAWDNSHKYVREFRTGALFARFVPAALSYIRLWDYYAAQRVDVYLTLSQYVAGRIKKYYGKDSRVVAPPVTMDSFRIREGDSSYYLVVSRLVPYKKIELAIEACELLGRPLKIVGVGPEMDRLRRLAGSWTSFLGFVPDEDLPLLYQGAKALLFTQEEDFGITPLEAAACGIPTIAYRAGGALETIDETVNGIFFDTQDVQSLVGAMQEGETRNWNKQAIRGHAQTFDRPRFLRELREIVQTEWEQWVRVTNR